MSIVVDPYASTDRHDGVMMRAKARVGLRLCGKWRLDVLLGVGGMAAVYAATHRNGSRAAVKVLHTELSIEPDLRARFFREGYLANVVGHDGVVKVIDDDTSEDGALFLVTELLDGETLEARRLRFGGRLPEIEVLAAVDQILEVLAAAHEKGLVHRDIKPENLFLTRAGQVKVLDFGIARLREVSAGKSPTQTGATMGTPAFMPPEQARGLWEEVDRRTDLWAVGATMFNLLSGRLLHEGRTPNEQLSSAMTKPVPALESVEPRVARSVARVVNRALEFERDKRWPDAGAMREALRDAYQEGNGTAITTAPKLLVPETVPNRTLSAAVSGDVTPALPTTARPVEKGDGSSGSRRVQRMAAAVVLGGALVAAGVATFVGLARPGHSVSAQAVPPSTTPPSTPPQSAVPSPADTPTNVPPLVAMTDLPIAAPPRLPAKPAAPRKGSTSAPASPPAAAAKPNCDPPFVVDPTTGKKTFKLECL